MTFPLEMGDYPAEHFFISMRDGVQINALRVFCREFCGKGAVLFFHGNARNISTELNQVLWLADNGYDVMLVDYRGYGLSSGDTDLAETLLDIEEICHWFLAHNAINTRKFMMAHSLGVAMSGYVVATHPQLNHAFGAVVFAGGFASYPQIMRDAMSKNPFISWLRYPASVFMAGRYDLDKVVAGLSPTPLLIMHGKKDAVVPFHHAGQIYKQAKEPKLLLAYDGWHNDAFESEERRRRVLDFLANAKTNDSIQ